MNPNDASSDYGTVTAAGTVRLERLLPGPIERLWEYLTVSEKRALWLAGGPTELRDGGTVELSFHNERLGAPGDPPPAKYAEVAGTGRVLGTVTVCEPPRRLAFTWQNEPAEDSSEVSFTLTPQGDQVLLEVVHRRLAHRGDVVSVSAGWHAHLQLLRQHLEAAPLASFWALHTRLEADYEQRIPR